MVFSSLLFLFFFLPIALILYMCSPRKLKNLCLFLLSLVFYAWGEPVYVLLLLASTAVDYMVGRGMERDGASPYKRKLLLISSIAVNLSVLGFFKYYAFAAGAITDWSGIPMPDWNPPLPIGISFYTFQTMSYTIDVYRRDIRAEQNFISFGCYVALFPQLIAGPIVRYRSIARELAERQMTSSNFVEGGRLFLIGLAKKVLLANNIGALWAEVQTNFMSGAGISAAAAWLGILAFAFQIYFDFSGYSDMAVGLGRMLGFTFPKNFDYPYTSQSITEFWRRWHMTLGTWFREYVYIPLGGNRTGRWRHVRNIFVVWLLTGLWHGASWNFVLWGLYFAIILWLEKWWILQRLERAPRFIRHMYACLLILLGWVLFGLESLDAVGGYLAAMFGQGSLEESGMGSTYALYLLVSYAGILLLCVVGSTSLPKKAMAAMQSRYPSMSSVMSGIAYLVLLLLCTAYLVDATYNPFLYFRF